MTHLFGSLGSMLKVGVMHRGEGVMQRILWPVDERVSPIFDTAKM